MPRMPLASLALSFALVLAASSTFAQSRDTRWWDTATEPTAFARIGNTVYVGGGFSSVGPITGGAALVDLTSGTTPDPPIVMFDLKYAVAGDGSGGWFCGGASGGLVHVDANGSLRPWHPAPNGYEVRALLVVDGKLIVAGDFTTIAGQPRNRIAAFDIATDQLLPWNPGVSGPVNCLAASGDTLYMGGSFTLVAGQPRSNIAAVSLANAAPLAWNPGANGSVLALLRHGSAVIAGGGFTQVGGLVRNRIAAVDAATGIVDPLWDPNSDGLVVSLAGNSGAIFAGGSMSQIGGRGVTNVASLAPPPSTGSARFFNFSANFGSVKALAVGPHGLYAGGSFTNTSGVDQPYFATVDTINGRLLSFTPRPNGEVRAMAVDGSRLLLAGAFVSCGGVRRTCLAAFDATTGRPTNFAVELAQGSISSLVASGDTLYMAGGFTSVNGVARGRLAAIDTRTRRLLPWNPDANSFVSTLILHQGRAYFGGMFTSVGGQLRNRLASADLGSGAVRPWNPNTEARVWTLAAIGDRVFAGGEFLTMGGQARAHIAALDTATGAPLAWNPGADLNVRSLQAMGSTLYAGGEFSILGGQPRSYAGAVDAFTGQATGWNPAPNFVIYGMAKRDDRILLGGHFYTVGSEVQPGFADVDGGVGQLSSWRPDFLTTSHTVAYLGGDLFVGRDYSSHMAVIHLAPAVSVGDGDAMQSSDLRVQPNPVRASARVEYAISHPGRVRIELLDISGRLLEVLADRMQSAGHHSFDWNATRPAAPRAPGLYFLRVSTPERTRMTRVAVLH